MILLQVQTEALKFFHRTHKRISFENQLDGSGMRIETQWDAMLNAIQVYLDQCLLHNFNLCDFAIKDHRRMVYGFGECFA